MSACLIAAGWRPGVAPQLSAPGGFGMLEFLIALLIFSAAIMGLLSTQLAGQRAGFEAAQRSVATALARDVIERIRANAAQADAYQLHNAGGSAPAAAPGADCDRLACSTAQLAAFDLWQWQLQLLGASQQYFGNSVGGLLSPRACITREGGTVRVAISWFGLLSATAATASDCGSDEAGLYAAPGGEPGNQLRRRQLLLSTYIGEG